MQGMDFNSLVSGSLTMLWVISTAVAVRLRASSRAQVRALQRLRDRDIEWALYAHDLRRDYALETGNKPPPIPETLRPAQPVNDEDFSTF